MEFARKQLEKYGWTDGKGLGKHENGISEALKPKLKRSMTGVGHDAASDFIEHWWSALYDKAASNIEVKEKGGATKKIKTKDGTGFEITNSTWKLKRKKTKSSADKPQEQYQDFFVRTAVLGSGGVKVERVRQSESESEGDDAQSDVFKVKMTDEELFAACEGRTAHKGARHGLKALGKLARIEQQEQLLLQQSRFNGYSHVNKHKMKAECDEDIVEDASLGSEEGFVKTKKKKKKKHCLKQDNDESLTQENHLENSCERKKKKKKSTNQEMLESSTTEYEAESVNETLPANVKRKKVNDTRDENKEVHGSKENQVDENGQCEVFSTIVKKSKKRKKDISNSEITSNEDSHKKNKKKKVKELMS